MSYGFAEIRHISDSYFTFSLVAVSFTDYIGWYYCVPVVLPPPKFVLNPNANTRSAVHLYIFASFSRISVFATVAWKQWRNNWEIRFTWIIFFYTFKGICNFHIQQHRYLTLFGWSTSTTICRRCRSRLVMNLRVLNVTTPSDCKQMED